MQSFKAHLHEELNEAAKGITSKRAKELLKMQRYGSIPMAFKEKHTNAKLNKNGITKAEDAAIRKVWSKMAGHTNYNNALNKIASGGLHEEVVDTEEITN